MSAEIICLADVRASRFGLSAERAASAAAAGASEQGARFHFWTGATGRRYVHTVYSLFDCPPLDVANYVLVRREGVAHRTVLAIGRLTNEIPTLNLAEIRQRAAALSADEVHVHLLASTQQEAHAVEIDLRTAQFATSHG